MKQIGILLRVLLLLTALSASLFAAYESDDFSGTLQGRWQTNLAYGRSGAIMADSDTYMSNVDGKMQITGYPHDLYELEGFWAMRYAMNTNKYNPSVTKPIGWEVIQEYANVDYDSMNNRQSIIHAALGMALFVSNDNMNLTFDNDTTYEWETAAAYMDFVWHTGVWAGYDEKLSVFDGLDIDITDYLDNAKRPDAASETNITDIVYQEFRPIYGSNSYGFLNEVFDGYLDADMPAGWILIDDSSYRLSRINHNVGSNAMGSLALSGEAYGNRGIAVLPEITATGTLKFSMSDNTTGNLDLTVMSSPDIYGPWTNKAVFTSSDGSWEQKSINVEEGERIRLCNYTEDDADTIYIDDIIYPDGSIESFPLNLNTNHYTSNGWKFRGVNVSNQMAVITNKGLDTSDDYDEELSSNTFWMESKGSIITPPIENLVSFRFDYNQMGCDHPDTAKDDIYALLSFDDGQSWTNASGLNMLGEEDMDTERTDWRGGYIYFVNRKAAISGPVRIMISNENNTHPILIDQLFFRRTSRPNTNKLGFRMIHDGSSVSFFVNPNPYDYSSGPQSIYPNEWMKLYERQVSWKNDVQFMIGHGTQDSIRSKYGALDTTKGADGRYDNFLVRSATESSRQVFSPKDIKADGSSNDVTVIISNTVQPFPTNAGVNMVKIVKPASFIWSTNLADIAITNVYDPSGAATAEGFTLEHYNYASPSLDPAKVYMLTNCCSNEMIFLFGKQYSNAGGGVSNYNIQISLKISTVPGDQEYSTKPLYSYVKAEQFGHMTAAAKGFYSTCGWQRAEGDGLFKEDTLPPQAYASITPNAINQGSTNYTFTYYLNAKNQDQFDVKQAAILVPYSFSNILTPSLTGISNLIDSLALGNNEGELLNGKRRVRIESLSNIAGYIGDPNASKTNVIVIDYSDGYELAPNALDVITLKAPGNPHNFNSNLSTNAWLWNSWVSTNLSVDKSQAMTNNVYQKLYVQVNGELVVRTWDFDIKGSEQSAPSSITTNNIYEMSYFEVVRDGENTTEEIDGVTVTLGGLRPDAEGYVYLYEHDSDDFSAATPIGTNAFDSGDTDISFSGLGRTHQTTKDAYEGGTAGTHYWAAIELTNTDTTGLFSNKISAVFKSLSGDGPNGGVFNNTDRLEYGSTNLTKVDSFTIELTTTYVQITNVRQNSLNNGHMSITFVNNDVDATNYFYEFYVTNVEDAVNDDLGVMTFTRSDNEDDIMSGPFSSEKEYRIRTAAPIVMHGTNTVTFDGAYNVKFDAAVNSKAALRLTSASDMIIKNEDGNRVSIITTIADPVATNVIKPGSSKDYDFYLNTISYKNFTPSFTTNQKVEVGYIDIVMDTEEPETQEFTGLDVEVLTPASAADVKGWLYLYREDGTSDGFDAAEDINVASNAVAGEAGVSISSFSETNISQDLAYPERYYLVFELTNSSMDAVKTNKIGFAITNLYCDGPDRIFTNLSELSGEQSRYANIDNYELIVNWVSNSVLQSQIEQGSLDFPMLKFSIRGDDPDSTNFLRSVTLAANSLNTASDNVAVLGVYSNEDGSLGFRYDLGGSFSSGTNLVSLGNNYKKVSIKGTNSLELMVAASIGFDEASTNKMFGIKTVAFSATNTVDDIVNRPIIYSGNIEGPTAETNIKILPADTINWDFEIVDAYDISDRKVVINNEVGLFSFMISRAGEADEYLTNIRVQSLSNGSSFSGILKVYTNNGANSKFTDSGSRLVASNSISDTDSIVNIAFNPLYISSDRGAKDKFFITYTPTNTDDSFSAVNAFSVVSLGYYGNQQLSLESTDMASPEISGLTKVTGLTNEAIGVEDASVTVTFTDLLSNSVVQGASGVNALTLDFDTADEDALFVLNSLKFTVDGDVSAEDISKLSVYNSSTATEIASATVSESGVAEAVISGGLTIDSAGVSLAVKIDIGADAVNEDFEILYNVSNQSSDSIQLVMGSNQGAAVYSPTDVNLSLSGTNYRTGICSIKLNIPYEDEAEAHVGNTLINPSAGEKALIYIDSTKVTADKLSGYKAYVYDIYGTRVRKIDIDNYQEEWDGFDDYGEDIPSGVYVIIIRDDSDKVVKTFKVMVKK